MKKTKYAVAALLMILSVPALAAEGDFLSSSSGNLSLTSDYVFRGISQSDESPAIQGSINLGQATGPYVGVWGSNVDFNDGDEAQFEADFSGGYKWQLNTATLDIGAIYYAYPGADNNLDYDYAEGKIGLSGPVGPATLGASLYISPDYFAGSGLAVYSNISGSIPVADTGLTINTAIGYQTIEKDAAFGVNDYTDWNMGLSYAWEKFNFAVAYYDTNLDRSECADGCEARVVGTITRNF